MKNRVAISLLSIACLTASASVIATETPPGVPAALAIALSLSPSGGFGAHHAWESMTTWTGGFETGAAIAGYDVGFLITA